MANEIKKNIITEVVSAATKSGFTAIATAAGYPMLSLAMPFVVNSNAKVYQVII